MTQLELLMRLRGFDADGASEIASRRDPEAAAEAFAAGAVLPVLPFAVTSGAAALTGASVLAGVVLFVVGSTISLLTNRPLLRSGLRQLLIGALTAAGTYLVGRSFEAVVG